jgi:hypothetical protein
MYREPDIRGKKCENKMMKCIALSMKRWEKVG